MTFFDWLMQHRGRRSRLGDLARYAAEDPQFPQSPAGQSELAVYLTDRQADENITRAAKNSWRSWRRLLREQKAAEALAEVRELQRLTHSK